MWKDLANRAVEVKVPFTLATVPCGSDRGLCRKQNVLAYPTVRWYNKGKAMTALEAKSKMERLFFETNQPNVAEEVSLAYDRQPSQDPQAVYDDVEAFKRLLTDHKVIFMVFCKPWIEGCQGWDAVLEEFHEYIETEIEEEVPSVFVDCVKSTEVCRLLENLSTYPTVHWYKKGAISSRTADWSSRSHQDRVKTLVRQARETIGEVLEHEEWGE